MFELRGCEVHFLRRLFSSEFQKQYLVPIGQNFGVSLSPGKKRRTHRAAIVASLLVTPVFLLAFSRPRAAAAPLQKAGSKRIVHSNANKQLGDHYLMLVNTAIAQFITDDKLRQFDKSPYDGIALAFLHAYDTSAPPSVAEMDLKLTAWKQFTSKDIWPWIYINRMIGSNLAEKNHYADNPYFNGIAGADLDDAKGARSDFLQLWRNYLSVARDSNIPGVVCDLEFYNNYKEYDIGELASRTGKTPAQAAESLKVIGARMADSAAEIYPHSMIWLLFAGLTHPGYKKFDGVPYYPSPTYISIGMLDEIVAKKLPIRVLAGGEGSIGYCHESLSDFRTAIAKRQSDLREDLLKYSGVLELGGTIAVWSDRKAKKEWMAESPCNACDADTIEDLGAYLQLLLRTYRYNWIYATSEGNYLPFSPSSAPRFDRVIRNVKDAVAAEAP